MKTEVMIYEGNEIEFTLEKNEKMMVNATEMAKPFDKQVSDFVRLDSTQAFIREYLKTGNSPFLEECLNSRKSENSRFLGVEIETDLIVSKQKSGTWMHHVLALKFAAWLSPAFEVWVYKTIHQLLFGMHVSRNESLERTIVLQKELETLRFKFGKTVEDFERYIEVEKELKRERAYRRALTNELIGGFEQKLLFP
jgi:hypothetical protein